jgi:hypothetical protein
MQLGWVIETGKRFASELRSVIVRTWLSMLRSVFESAFHWLCHFVSGLRSTNHWLPALLLSFGSDLQYSTVFDLMSPIAMESKFLLLCC